MITALVFAIIATVVGLGLQLVLPRAVSHIMLSELDRHAEQEPPASPTTFRITEVFSGETRDIPMPGPQVPPDVMDRIDAAPWPDRSEWGQS